ncbi:hypothetical protein NDU88_004559 [Pleurodeles waltl]|uniref:Uncharacterized protein n=1 Tax=Pleurodeles waltl TaxID=8319 RepID=A0AAV7V5G9_PLEWA|nr:hypothetical protein NDU88_004559 [Pleurodeles waltl]
MASSGRTLVAQVLPLVWVLPSLIRVPLLVWVPPLVRVLPLLVRVPPLLQVLPSLCVVSRLPLPLFPSSPGLRREVLYKALRHPEMELDRFLPDIHPGQEQCPNWCPRGIAGATEMRSTRHKRIIRLDVHMMHIILSFTYGPI